MQHGDVANKKQLLGVFDSGIGGFSVLNEIRDATSADIVYFGDCARAPYGNREEEEIVLFIKEIIRKLQMQEVTHFVSACNSMSVMTTDMVLKDCAVPHEMYIDMLRAFKMYSDFPENAKVLIIGTQATLRSGAYQSVLNEKNIEAYEYAFPSLAGSIEKGAPDSVLIKIIRPCIDYAIEVGATHILYACTHYPLIDYVFKHCADDAGWKGVFVNPATYVKEAILEWNLEGERNTSCEASEETEAFIELSKVYASI